MLFKNTENDNVITLYFLSFFICMQEQYENHTSLGLGLAWLGNLHFFNKIMKL